MRALTFVTVHARRDAALVTALGTKDDEQRIELLDATESSKRFMLHYNFPPFSVGEVGFMRGADDVRSDTGRCGTRYRGGGSDDAASPTRCVS